jgi:hypothetical protein
MTILDPLTRTSDQSRKRRIRKCAVCREQFEPRSISHKACKPTCATTLVQQQREKADRKAAKAARAATREEKRANEKTSVKLDRLQAVVNEIARVRDSEFGCISCNKTSYWTGGDWHGSHFKSVGSNSALRFNLWNIHKACDQCNYFQAGNIASYEVRLRIKIGDDRVDWLKNHPREREYSREWLDRAREVARKYLRRLKKRKGTA